MLVRRIIIPILLNVDDHSERAPAYSGLSGPVNGRADKLHCNGTRAEIDTSREDR